MKTRLIWRECYLNENKNSFWVECTDQEVADLIIPYLDENDPEIFDKIKGQRGHSLINENQNEKIYCNFFLVSFDFKNILSFSWQMPYSGLWNSSNPFRMVDVTDFHSLEELKTLNDKYGSVDENS